MKQLTNLKHYYGKLIANTLLLSCLLVSYILAVFCIFYGAPACFLLASGVSVWKQSSESVQNRLLLLQSISSSISKVPQLQYYLFIGNKGHKTSRLETVRTPNTDGGWWWHVDTLFCSLATSHVISCTSHNFQIGSKQTNTQRPPRFKASHSSELFDYQFLFTFRILHHDPQDRHQQQHGLSCSPIYQQSTKINRPRCFFEESHVSSTAQGPPISQQS